MKRVLSILLVALLSLGLFAACDRPLTKYPVPSADEFATGFFDVIANVEEGTAGASLKLAKAAVQAAQFAQDTNVANIDQETLRANMLEAYTNVLKPAQQKSFDTNFLRVMDFLKSAHEDYDSVAGVLEDAGVKEAFDKLMAQDNAWANWESLAGNVLTLGNSES